MKYMLVIYEDPSDVARREGEPAATYWEGWKAYGAALRAAGVLVGGAALQPIATATTLRLKDGKRQVQDGPYAETKDQFAGFYTLEVESVDQALEWAAKCPALPKGAVELRPVLLMS
jgi:hypothetical protein